MPRVTTRVPRTRLGAVRPQKNQTIGRKGGVARTLARALGQPIEHVVLLVLENRSFDHVFGDSFAPPVGLRGATPATVAPNILSVPPGQLFPGTHQDYSFPKKDPAHDPKNVQDQLYPRLPGLAPGAPNTGFAEDYRRERKANPREVLDVFRRGSFPALQALADNYRLCTRWHSALPGPTWPNRYFILCGNSAPQGAAVAMASDPSGMSKFWHEAVKGRKFEASIFSWVEDSGKTWGVFESGLWSHARSIALDHSRFHKLDEFYQLLKQGPLPDFSYIEASWLNFHLLGVGPSNNDMHPGESDPRRGDALVAEIYNHLRKSPFWDKTLLAIVFDEHGGLYDHREPPGTTPPNSTPSEVPQLVDFKKLGVRVPAIFVSPWVDARPDDTLYDHTSMLRIIGEALALKLPMPRGLGARAAAANSFQFGGMELRGAVRADTECPSFIPGPAGEVKSLDSPDAPLSDYQRGLVQLLVVQDLASPRGGRGMTKARTARKSPKVSEGAVNDAIARVAGMSTLRDVEQYLHESGRTGRAAFLAAADSLPRETAGVPESTLTLADARPGDLVFFHGTGIVSSLIRQFDRTDYNHVALVKDAATLAQADWPGIGTVDFSKSVRETRYALVRRLALVPPTLEPVITRMNEYLATGDRYAYEQIVLLAFLALTRSIPLPLGAKEVLRSLLDQAAGIVNRMIANGREPMICSEFCLRCYNEGAGGHTADYRIAVNLDRGLVANRRTAGTLLGALQAARTRSGFTPLPSLRELPRPTDPRAALSELVEPLTRFQAGVRSGAGALNLNDVAGDPGVQQAAERFILALTRPELDPPAARDRDIKGAYRSLTQVLPDFVTPGDLRASQSLVDVGTLPGGDAVRAAAPALPRLRVRQHGPTTSTPQFFNRALLVGINAYPTAPLRGCVNDVTRMADLLVSHFGFGTNDVRILTDDRATTEGIKSRLGWLLNGARAGDRLLFHYSGHGAQVATRNPQGEVDGLDEVICPVDFDWTEPHLIRDKEFRQMFLNVPEGVEFVWISDSCHSQDLSRELIPGVTLTMGRTFPMTADMAWRVRTAKGLITPLGLPEATRDLSVALLSACRSEQTAADAVFPEGPGGAFTHFLIEALVAAGGAQLPLTSLVGTVRQALGSAGYSQVPQVEGSSLIQNRGFLSAG